MSVDRNVLESWGDQLDTERVREVEEQMVDKHDGEVTIIPEAVAASVLGYLLSSIECDLESGEIDQETHTKFAYAWQLHLCVHDSWNGRFE